MLLDYYWKTFFTRKFLVHSVMDSANYNEKKIAAGLYHPAEGAQMVAASPHFTPRAGERKGALLLLSSSPLHSFQISRTERKYRLPWLNTTCGHFTDVMLRWIQALPQHVAPTLRFVAQSDKHLLWCKIAFCVRSSSAKSHDTKHAIQSIEPNPKAATWLFKQTTK